MSRLKTLPARYGLALGLSVIVTFLYLRHGAGAVGSDLSYFGFTLAVLLAALLGGLGPGLVATAASAVASAFFLLSPLLSMWIASGRAVAHLILFAADGILLSLVANLVRNTGTTTQVDLSRFRRYLPALLFVAAATGLKLLLFRGVEDEMPFAFFYTATVASAWLAGLGPGLAATCLSSLAARFLFLTPRYSLSVSSDADVVRLSAFILEGVILSSLSAKYAIARKVAGDAVKQVHDYAGRLKKSMEDVHALKTTSRDTVWEWDVAPDRMVRVSFNSDDPEDAANATNLSSWLQQIHPEDRGAVRASLNAALSDGSDEWRCEYRIQRPVEGLASMSDHAEIIRDDENRPIRVVGRTAVVRSSEGVAPPARSEPPQYPGLYGRKPIAFLWVDRALRIVSANRAASELLEYSNAELHGRPIEEMFLADRQQQVKESLITAMAPSRSATTLYEQCVRASGELFGVKIHAAAINGAGRIPPPSCS